MPQYHYKVRDNDGALQTGVMEAAKKEAVADKLAGMGLFPVLIEEQAAPSGAAGAASMLLSRVSSQDIIVFSRQLATLVSGGIPFIQSLATLERQTESPRLKTVIAEVRRDVEGGLSFSDALAKHPRIFTKLYVSMVRAGETAGILDDILERLALLSEHDADTRARVKAAVRYPVIVLASVCAAFFFLVSFVVPKFSAIFSRFGTQLPLPTRVLIVLNLVIQNYWYLLLIGVVAVVSGVLWYVNTPRGRRQWDLLKLRLPVFGVLFKKVALSRFARVFSAMQRSGLSMMLTLEIVQETVGNAVIADVILKMQGELREGKGLVAPMEASGLFPPLMVQMIAVGEETGSIDVMLNKVSDYYDRDVEYALRNLSTMIEPILLLLVGGMVLFLALGIFLPMWDMISLFRK
jgi:type II secretory pathway component PulF